jgi:hypothetical protein
VEALAAWLADKGAKARAVRADDVTLMLASPEEKPFTREG